jgi:cytidylate kinase
MVVAIDGPAGAGKSTVARALAEDLGWEYVDTGAMYRALALKAVESGLEPSDEDALVRLARSLRLEARGDRMMVNGVDVSDRIRAADVTASVSAVSAHPGVRSLMAELQRRLARRGCVVMEGRDIGTSIVPEAELKVYLTASLRERARRRARQLEMPEEGSVLADLEASLAARDASDSARATSPLARPEGALVIDSTHSDVDSVVAAIAARVREQSSGG